MNGAGAQRDGSSPPGERQRAIDGQSAGRRDCPASLEAGPGGGSLGSSSRRGPAFGVDVKKVRRKLGPRVKGYATGSLQEALRVAGSRVARRRARRELKDDVYARTTRQAMKRKKATVGRVLRKAGHAYLPMTPEKMKDLSAALTAARYRSIPSYLSAWRRDHVMAAHAWTEQLEQVRQDCHRAVTRGIGPARRAATYRAEELPRVHPGPHEPVVKGGPRWPGHFVAVGSCWLLRGLELADLLGEQAGYNDDTREAWLDLAASKMDPQGRGCMRTLKCLCASEYQGPCPYCSLRDLLTLRVKEGLGPKDPLFPSRSGSAASRDAAVRTIRVIVGLPDANEHSPRRAGSQMLARRFIPLFLIQFLGRWGGQTVAIYVGEALQKQLAAASATGGAPTAGEGGSPCPASWAALKREVRTLAKKALAEERRAGSPAGGEQATTHGARIAAVTAGSLTASEAASPGAPVLPARQVRGYRGQQETGEFHDVLVCDPCLPREGWVTRCGWRFAGSNHILFEAAQTTCSTCLRYRAAGVEAAARRKHKERVT